MTTATKARYEVKDFPTYSQIVDDEGFVIFRNSDPKAVAAEYLRLTGVDRVWEPTAARRYCPSPVVGATRVHVEISVCDRNVDRARAIYREIKGAELDETPRSGYYRYPPGPRNANPNHERKFGHLIVYRATYYFPDGRKCVEHHSVETVLSLLHAGYNLGMNDLV